MAPAYSHRAGGFSRHCRERYDLRCVCLGWGPQDLRLPEQMLSTVYLTSKNQWNVKTPTVRPCNCGVLRSSVGCSTSGCIALYQTLSAAIQVCPRRLSRKVRLNSQPQALQSFTYRSLGPQLGMFWNCFMTKAALVFQ